MCTLTPNLSAENCFCKSSIKVPLPTPEGPQITTGRHRLVMVALVLSKHYAKERGEGRAGWMDLDFGSSNDGRYVHLIPICWR